VLIVVVSISKLCKYIIYLKIQIGKIIIKDEL
jgi:hypothetical protein